MSLRLQTTPASQEGVSSGSVTPCGRIEGCIAPPTGTHAALKHAARSKDSTFPARCVGSGIILYASKAGRFCVAQITNGSFEQFLQNAGRSASPSRDPFVLCSSRLLGRTKFGLKRLYRFIRAIHRPIVICGAKRLCQCPVWATLGTQRHGLPLRAKWGPPPSWCASDGAVDQSPSQDWRRSSEPNRRHEQRLDL